MATHRYFFIYAGLNPNNKEEFKSHAIQKRTGTLKELRKNASGFR